MPGQLNSLKPRKRKSCSKVKSTRKASTKRRRVMKSPKMHSAAESSTAVSGYSKGDGPERPSLISCECHQSPGRGRCSASPSVDKQEGKENELRMGLDVDSCRVNGTLEKQDPEDMECEGSIKNIFLDDDSNQILPVEQFFGNLDVVQDFPQKLSATSRCFQRERRRRRHYYAREDSNEEVCSGSAQGD